MNEQEVGEPVLVVPISLEDLPYQPQYVNAEPVITPAVEYIEDSDSEISDTCL